jgi:tRNA pseudouridine32 synthase/23S rRNA pseudouridine746 synthase
MTLSVVHLSVVHIDDGCVLIDKPAGLLSVPGRGPALQDCAITRLQAQVPDALVVHRLDMATSGLLLFARGTRMQRALSAAFAARQVHKRYVAVVHGRLAQTSGEIDLPLAADWPNRPRQQVDAVHGKPSLTRYRVLAFDATRDRTRVELEPVTGRAHQLRVHLLALGHPIVRDALYGAADDSDRLLLHASALAFDHPASGASMHIESAVPF